MSMSKDSRKLPEWLDHFNRKDLKTLFKCSIATWIYTLLIFINPTLAALGQATFFGCIVLFIVPPSGVVFIHLMAGVSIILGLAIGWAWGAITMKAGLATRPAADVNARMMLLRQSVPHNATTSQQSNYVQIQLFNGFMLDTRVTVTYFSMICLLIYFMSRLRVKAPKLALVQIFAIVVMDIYLTTAPLIPSFLGTVPKSMVIPVAIATGIGVVCNILFFPQSTSSIVLQDMQTILEPMSDFLEACYLNFQQPQSQINLEKLSQTKVKVTDSYKAFELSATFLPMDISMGKWSSEELSSLKAPFRQVLVTFTDLLQLQINREEQKTKDERLLKAAEDIYNPEKSEKSGTILGHHQISRALDFRVQARHPDTDELLQKNLRSLAEYSESLVNACIKSFSTITQALSQSCTTNWFHSPPVSDHRNMVQMHKNILEELIKAEKDFVSLATDGILHEYKHILDKYEKSSSTPESSLAPPVFGLMLSLLFQDRMMNFSKALIALLSKIVEIEEFRETNRLWLPAHIQRLGKWVFKDEAVPDVRPRSESIGLNSRTPPSKALNKERKTKNKKSSKIEDSESSPSAESQLKSMRTSRARKRSKSSKILLGLIRWFFNVEGIFALRVVIATLALSIPAVVKSTAGFYYREKGMWALIMAQFAMVPYTSDFVFGVLVRIGATALGGIIGMVCWYIGAGNGPGNPYGMAAVMAVVVVVFMWLRLFTPPDMIAAIVMMVATIYMVVSYSWIDTHSPTYGNPGVGYTIFWRRILLVMVGFGVAAVVTFLPRPPSAGRHYRQVLSESLGSVKDRYALLASNWKTEVSDLIETAEKEAILTSEKLTEIVDPIKLSKFEFSTSNIDAETLSRACQICIGMNEDITQLIIYTTKLPQNLKSRFFRLSSVVNENMIADIMAVLSLVQQALRSGEPLPAVIPTPLVARSMIIARKAMKVDDMTRDLSTSLGEEGTRQYVAAMSAFIHLLGSADDLVMVMKGAVGETSHVRLDIV